MKTYCTFFTLLLACCLGVSSCEEQVGKTKNIDRNLIDTSKKDIPQLNGRQTPVFDFVTKMSSRLELDDILNGFDSLQIRIWYSYAFKDSGQLIVLYNQDKRWNCNICTYRFTAESGTRDTKASFLFDNLPKSGWRSFIDSLIALDILTLPDMDALPNNEYLISEGDVFTVEIATKTNYRLYTYTSPYYFQDEFTQARQMEEILRLIEREFNFKRLRLPTEVINKPIEYRDVRIEPVTPN